MAILSSTISILLTTYLLVEGVKSTIGRSIIVPICISTIFYTIWPTAEQALFNISPARGDILKSNSIIAINSIQSVSVIAIITISWLLRPQLNTLNNSLSKAVHTYKGEGTFLTIVTGALLLTFNTNLNPLQLLDYNIARDLSYNNPGIPISKQIFSIGIALFALGSANTRGRFSPITIIAILLPVLIAILTSDKNPILPTLFVLSIHYGEIIEVLVKKNRILSALSIVFVSMLLFTLCISGILFLRYFSAIRGQADLLEFSQTILASSSHDMSITISDPGGPYLSLSEEFNQGIPQKIKLSPAERIQSMIPRFLTGPERPDAMDVTYGLSKISKWTPGAGVGYHPLADFQAYFGFLGSWLYLPTLATIAWFCTWLKLITKGPHSVGILVSLVIFSDLLISHRTMIEGTIKSIIIYTGCTLPILYTSTVMSRTFRKLK